MRPLVLFALIASVACTGSPRMPEAAATPLPTLAPMPAFPVIAPDITVPPLVAPITSALPLPNVAPPPTAVPLPSVAPLRIATPRPLSTIPIVIRPAAPIPTPGLVPLPTSLPILPVGH